MFCNISNFDCEDLLAPRPNPKLEDHPLSTVRNCWFNIFDAIFHIKAILHLQLEDEPWLSESDQITMVPVIIITVTSMVLYIYIYIYIYIYNFNKVT